jgi:hypothetical protein
MTAYDIDYINQADPVVEYDYMTSPADRDTIDYFTERFEREHNVSEGDDIGGLIVYNKGSVVYDYENFCGWVK